MEYLDLKCDFNDNDSIQLSENGNRDKVIIDVVEDDNHARILLGKEKAAKLRDRLNVFLGDS